MTERCEIRQLKQGDHVILDDGSIAIVRSAKRAALFEGDAWEVETDKGSSIHSGDDVVEVHN